MKCLHPEASCTQDVENLGPVCRDIPNVDRNPGGQRATSSKAQEDQTGPSVHSEILNSRPEGQGLPRLARLTTPAQRSVTHSLRSASGGKACAVGDTSGLVPTCPSASVPGTQHKAVETRKRWRKTQACLRTQCSLLTGGSGGCWRAGPGTGRKEEVGSWSGNAARSRGLEHELDEHSTCRHTMLGGATEPGDGDTTLQPLLTAANNTV